MKMSKRILSSILAILMVVSVCSVGFTVNAADEPSGAILDEIVLEPIPRPEVEFYCTEVTRVAAAVNSVEPGETIVKATPSGVPELSGSYVAQAYAGETPVATTVTFVSPTVGIQVNGISCNNENVVLSGVQYSNGKYTVTIESGTVAKNEDGTYDPLVFTVDYTWTDGNQYQGKCVSYVEPVATGGSYVEIQRYVKGNSGSGHRHIVNASASTRLLGKGVYYEMPANIETSTDDPYLQYGVYNVATGTLIENVAAGYNTLLYKDDKSENVAGSASQIVRAYDAFAPGTTIAHVYLDSSVSKTLVDQNIRLDANVGALPNNNVDYSYTALADAAVLAGVEVSSANLTNDIAAQSAIGLDIPAKADHGVTQAEKDSPFNTITPGVAEYGNLFTQPLTGTVANLVDGSSFTIMTKYYAYDYSNQGLLQKFNSTASATVPVAMVFHVVDKTVLREAIDHVMNSDPETPAVREKNKGINPQAWYYSSGFNSFQEAYVEAINVLNNPKASQTEINAKATSLEKAYNGLNLKKADYAEVDSLKTQANAIKKNASAYTDDSIALINEALNGVKANYSILYQGAVDTMANNLDTAIKNAKLKPADYSEIDRAREIFESYDEADYVPSTWKAVEDAFAVVVEGKYADEQETVDAWAEAIVDAMNGLIKVSDLAVWTDLDNAISEADDILDLSIYENGNAVTAAVKAAENAKASNEETPWTSDRQPEIDGLAQAIRDAIKNLKIKKPNKDLLKAAIDATIPGNKLCYDQDVLAEYEALVVSGTIMYNNDNLTIKDQAAVDAKAREITNKYDELMSSFAHTESAAVVENNVEATCTTPGGYDTVVYCEVCGEEISRKTTNISALGHKAGEEVVENNKEATCTTDGGYDTVTYCTVCGEEASRVTTTIKALGHTKGEAVKENEVAATCTTKGGYDTVTYCTVCGVEVTRVPTQIPALGHKKGAAVKENEVAATCTEKGSYDTVVYCTVCGEKVSSVPTQTPALGHKKGAAVKENEVAATCTAPGGYDTVVYCKVCEAEMSRVPTTINALGHKPAAAVKENEVPATRDEAGSYDSVVYCSVCEVELSRETITVESIGHDAAEAVIENEVAATCTKEGSYDSVVYCSCCEDKVELSRDTITIPVIAHTEGEAVKEKEVEVTCTTDGSFDTVVYCTVCDKELSRETTVISAEGHDYETKVTAPTCTEAGYTTYTCTVCGDTYTDDEVEALGHTEGEWKVTKPADIGVVGEETLYCAACGEAWGTREIPAISAYFKAAEGTTTVVDKDHKIIYGLAENIDDLEGFVEYEGGILEYEETARGFGTGTVVNFIVNGEVYESYTIVIFGDLDGDSVVDSYDTVILAKIANYDISVEEGSALAYAADIAENDGVVDTYDLAKLYKAANFDITLSQVQEIVFPA